MKKLKPRYRVKRIQDLKEGEIVFDEEFDGTLCKVSNVLQVFDTKEAADYAEGLFYPGNYDVDGPAIRVVAEADLLKTFR